MKKLYLVLLSIFLFQGCSGLRVTPTKLDKNGKAVSYAPVPVEDVKIYSVTKVKGDEFAIVSLEGQGPSVDKIFENFRKIASENGANYVSGFKLKTELKSEMVSYQSCSGSGPGGAGTSCTTQIRTETKQYYKATGSLVRKSE